MVEQTTGVVTFKMYDIDPPWCMHPSCTSPARYEIALVGSAVHYSEVCGRHKAWGKSNLVARDMRHRGLIP